MCEAMCGGASAVLLSWDVVGLVRVGWLSDCGFRLGVPGLCPVLRRGPVILRLGGGGRREGRGGRDTETEV